MARFAFPGAAAVDPAGLTVGIEGNDPRICWPQRASQARQRAGEVAVALFRVRLRPESFNQGFLCLAVRATEGEMREQDEGLAFERKRRTMLPQEIRIWPSSSMYSTFASLVTIWRGAQAEP